MWNSVRKKLRSVCFVPSYCMFYFRYSAWFPWVTSRYFLVANNRSVQECTYPLEFIPERFDQTNILFCEGQGPRRRHLAGFDWAVSHVSTVHINICKMSHVLLWGAPTLLQNSFISSIRFSLEPWWSRLLPLGMAKTIQKYKNIPYLFFCLSVWFRWKLSRLTRFHCTLFNNIQFYRQAVFNKIIHGPFRWLVFIW